MEIKTVHDLPDTMDEMLKVPPAEVVKILDGLGHDVWTFVEEDGNGRLITLAVAIGKTAASVANAIQTRVGIDVDD